MQFLQLTKALSRRTELWTVKGMNLHMPGALRSGKLLDAGCSSAP